MHFRKQSSGFTLIELIVTLVVAIVLTLLAAPMFTSITSGNEMSAATNLLSTHMNLARSEAIKRGNAVTICPSGDGSTCADTNQWALGWLVFEDKSGTTGERDGTDVIIAISPSLENGVSIGSSHTYVRYLADGTIDLPN